MNFTVATIARSLADYLAPHLPGVAFFEDPNQQGSTAPCMFLQTRYSYLALETGGHWRRRMGLDLTYLEDYDLPDMQQRYQRAAETLDLLLETFPYSDGETGGAVLLRTYEREWRIDPDALHYRFELRERVSSPKAAEKMRTLDYSERVTDGSPAREET